MSIEGQPRDRPRRIVRGVAALLAGSWLAWQIGMAGLAGLAVRSNDADLLSLTGTPAHPDAGAFRAQTMLAAGDKAGAAILARAVVVADPANDRAVRVLGIATEQTGNADAGANIMRVAAGLGWRDTPTQLWVIRDAAVRGDVDTLMQRVDAMARRGQSPLLTRSIFFTALTDPRLRPAFIASLAGQPSWRAGFFSEVRQYLPAASVGGMATLLGEMQAGHHPVSATEWLSLIERLIDLGDYQRARALWGRTFSIPAARLAAKPYDGDFALVAARGADVPISQFEWSLNADAAGATGFGGGGSGTALSIPTDLTGGTTIMTQLLTLAPGSYTLSTGVDGDAALAAAGWSISCLPSGRELPRRLPRGAEDELTTVSFEVTGDGCAAQRLTLATRDRLGAQAVSITDVRIR